MKKIIIILVIIAALFGLYWVNRTPDAPIENGPVSSENGFRPNPSNATILFDDGPITLSQGKNTRSIAPDSAIMEETTITEHITYGDINADNRNDAAMIILRQGGASGLFVYVAGFVSGSSSYKGTNAIFIGDRISPQSISIEDGVVTVEYLDRNASEPLAAEPTVLMTKKFTFRSGELVER